MSCICECRNNSESFKVHSAACDAYTLAMAAQAREDQLQKKVDDLETFKRKIADLFFEQVIGHAPVSDRYYKLALKRIIEHLSDLDKQEVWNNQDTQCTGPGYSHKAHGACSGYSTDRT